MLIQIRGRYIFLFIILLTITILRKPIISKISSRIPNIGDKKSLKNKPHDPIIISYKKIDDQAVSKDENILIHQIPWLNDNEGIKKQCTENWQLKLSSEFDRYLQKCPIDIEAQIYSNNNKVREKAANLTTNTIVNIAIVVPISDKKEELKNKLSLIEQEKKFNGMRVFDSIEILRGIEKAQQENINGIQLGDRKIFLEIMIIDDSYIDNISDEQKAQESANYLVDSKNTVAVVGHFSSDSIQAAAIIYNDKLVAFSPTSTAIRIDNGSTSSSDNSDKLRLNSYIFRTVPNDKFAIKTLIDVIRKENLKNSSLETAMILYEEENSFSKSYKQYFEKEFLEKIDNSKIVDDPDSPSCRFYDNEATNQKKYCEQAIRTNKPDLLLLVPSTKRASELAGTVLKGINDLYPKPQLLGADSMHDQFFLSDFSEGMIVAVPVQSNEKTKLSWRGAMTYDATKAIIKGIEDSDCNIDSDNSNYKINECLRQEIQKVLSEDNFKADGILGNNTVFFENGDREIDQALEKELEEPLQVKKSEDTNQYSFELY